MGPFLTSLPPLGGSAQVPPLTKPCLGLLSELCILCFSHVLSPEVGWTSQFAEGDNCTSRYTLGLLQEKLDRKAKDIDKIRNQNIIIGVRHED